MAPDKPPTNPPNKPEEERNKIISLFERHRQGGEFHFDVGEEGGKMVISPDGFHYVTFRYTEDAVRLEKEELELAERRNYIFKMLEHHKDATRINHYYVPSERLDEFLETLPTRHGTLLEIKPYIPDTTA